MKLFVHSLIVARQIVSVSFARAVKYLPPTQCNEGEWKLICGHNTEKKKVIKKNLSKNNVRAVLDNPQTSLSKVMGTVFH